jgi:hypothetical protein
MHKQIKFIYALLIIVIIGGGITMGILREVGRMQVFYGVSKITENLKNSKEIIEINRIRDDIDNLIKNGLLKEVTKDDSNEIQELSRFYVDGDGNIFKHIIHQGSEDSYLTYNFYYSDKFKDHNYPQVKLFYVLIIGNAVNDSSLHHEIYFNDKGERMSESHNITGEGWGWPEVWPQDDIIFNTIKK